MTTQTTDNNPAQQRDRALATQALDGATAQLLELRRALTSLRSRTENGTLDADDCRALAELNSNLENTMSSLTRRDLA